MNDTPRHGDIPLLTADQIRDLVAALCGVFGTNLSQAPFLDKLMMFLEDVPGYESDDALSSLIELAWAEYASRRP